MGKSKSSSVSVEELSALVNASYQTMIDANIEYQRLVKQYDKRTAKDKLAVINRHLIALRERYPNLTWRKSEFHYSIEGVRPDNSATYIVIDISSHGVRASVVRYFSACSELVSNVCDAVEQAISSSIAKYDAPMLEKEFISQCL